MQTSEIIIQQSDSIVSGVDSLAPAHQLRENEKDSTTKNPLSGGNTCESSSQCDPGLLLSRIQKALSTTDLEQYLPASEWQAIHGTIRSSYRHLGSAHHTAAIDFLLLPTPTTYPKSSGRGGAAGQNKLERTLRLLPTPVARDYKGPGGKKYGTDSLPRIVHGHLSKSEQMSPAVPGWMMGFPPGWVESVLMDGGQTTRRQSTQASPRKPLSGEALLVAMGYRLSHLRQCSPSCESSISPPLQPTEADIGKEIYVDVVEKRGIFRGGIHKRIVSGTEVTFGVVKFPDCQSPTLFPLEEIELVEEEKTTAQAIAKQTKSQGEYTMSAQVSAKLNDKVVNANNQTAWVTSATDEKVTLLFTNGQDRKLTWNTFNEEGWQVVHEEHAKIQPYLEQRMAIPDDDAVQLNGWTEKISEIVKTTTAALTPEVIAACDEEELEQLEEEIQQIQQTAWQKIGVRLLRIREGKLYLAKGYKTWDSYCRGRWGYGDTQANDIINAVKAQEAITATTVTLPSVNAAKPIAKMLNAGIEPEQIQEVVQEVAAAGELSRASIEDKAREKGLLPPKKQAKNKDAVVAQEFGLPVNGLPEVEQNDDEEPQQLPDELLHCLNLLEVTDYIRAKKEGAIAEFTALSWQQRFDLRSVSQNTIDTLLLGCADEPKVRPVRGLLEADKSAKIDWLEGEVLRLMRENDELKQKIGGHSRHKQKDENTTVEWYTPENPYIEMVRECFGGQIDTDPASNDFAQEWIKARIYFTKETDGLANSDKWEGFVFCNPPYGNEPRKWIAETVRLYQSGQIKGAIFLINRSGSNWFRNVKPNLSAICQVHQRIKFINQQGEVAKSPMYDNDFLCIGDEIVEQFVELFSGIGDVTAVQPEQRLAA